MLFVDCQVIRLVKVQIGYIFSFLDGFEGLF